MERTRGGIAHSENRQAVRLRRFLLAASAYGVCLPLLAIAEALHILSPGAAVATATVMIVLNGALFVVFRANLNERFADPSLTWAQIIAATIVLMFVVYHVNGDRGMALMMTLVVLSFGAFRFNTREFLTASGVVLAAYAAVINLLMWFAPERIDVPMEAFRWTMLAFVLPCYAMVAGRLSELRQRVRRTNEELVRALETIQKLATHDTLTGLPNRALFNETLGHAIAQATRHRRSAALFFLDLDRFKNINDTLGHGVGDRVLQEAARRLTGAVRASDMVARLGGDEFVLLVEEFAERSDLVDIAGKIQSAFSAPFVIGGHDLALSVSVGICTYPEDGTEPRALLSNADIAMYRAKDQGRNRHCFYAAGINHLTEERLSLEAALRRALSRGEIEVYYQPKIGFGNGRVTGVEALIRWHHPQLGLLAPDKFVPLAEEIGEIVPIGYWTIKSVCERMRRWHEQGMPLAVAVNLSASQFHEPELVDKLGAILRATGVAPDMLELEITESMVMRDPDRAVGVMKALRAMGVPITIDDFGTGHSSLGYLKHFPISRLKVDRSFVRDLPHNGDDIAITRAVIAMAHSLRMSVVAEGVEDQEQFDILREEGCDEFQGYYCRPPLREQDLMRFLDEQRHRVAAARPEPARA
jgi:diguanylate cyclase (GGDEF)-like protein